MIYLYQILSKIIRLKKNKLWSEDLLSWPSFSFHKPRHGRSFENFLLKPRSFCGPHLSFLAHFWVHTTPLHGLKKIIIIKYPGLSILKPIPSRTQNLPSPTCVLMPVEHLRLAQSKLQPLDKTAEHLWHLYYFDYFWSIL